MPIVTLSEDPARLEVSTDFQDKELIKQVPGSSWSTVRKVWTVPRSWAACLQLRGVFHDRLIISPEVREWASALKPLVAEATEARAIIDGPESFTGLFTHQRGDVHWLTLEHTRSGSALTNDMGTGKSPALASALRKLLQNGSGVLPALIVCPNSVKPAWEETVLNWFPETTPYLVSSGNKAKVLKKALADPTAVVIVNYDLARTLSRLAPYGSIRLKRCVACGGGDETVKATSCEVHQKALNEFGFQTVVVDEAHRLKDPKAKQTRAVWALGHAPSVRHRFAATGTPIANHIGDFWPIGHFMAPHEYPNRSKFLDRYALMSWNSWGGMDIVGIRPDTKDELFAFMDARVRRVTKAQADLGLPPKLRSIRQAVMPPAARKAYDKLAADLITTMPNGDVLFTPNSLTQELRLMQLSSSFSERREDEKWYLVDKPASWKLDVLDEIVDELGPDRQFGVCALSRQLIELAMERFEKRGIKFGAITGRIREDDRRRYLAEFQAGKLQAILFTIQAGGTGLTMTAGDTLVFLQRSWSLIENKQAEDRFHRIGSERHESINLIDVIAADTVELKQVGKLHQKLKLLEEVNRDDTMDEVLAGDDDLRGVL